MAQPHLSGYDSVLTLAGVGAAIDLDCLEFSIDEDIEEFGPFRVKGQEFAEYFFGSRSWRADMLILVPQSVVAVDLNDIVGSAEQQITFGIQTSGSTQWQGNGRIQAMRARSPVDGAVEVNLTARGSEATTGLTFSGT